MMPSLAPARHTSSCSICGWSETWTTRDAAGCAATWHVYQEHPQTWTTLFGTASPRDPRPGEVGWRL